MFPAARVPFPGLLGGSTLLLCAVTRGAAQVVLVVKNPPANAGDITDTSSIPGSGRSLEEDTVTLSRTLAWRSPCTEGPGGLQSLGSEGQTGLGAHAVTWACTWEALNLSPCAVFLSSD